MVEVAEACPPQAPQAPQALPLTLTPQAQYLLLQNRKVIAVEHPYQLALAVAPLC
jgi:hypothetical protein